ncbi:MAG TPA: hypothetical protein VNT30_03125 [Stellaceae bacterium]|nr:hypothetical protein [Stellaceae bacterium]
MTEFEEGAAPDTAAALGAYTIGGYEVGGEQLFHPDAGKASE